MTSSSRVAVVALAAATLAGCGSAPPSATVPNVVGQALDAAKSVLVTAGFPAEPQDLLRGRNPLLDSDWTVCTQTPGPVAAAAAGSTVDLGVVKKAETCPDGDPAVAPSSAARARTAAPTTHAARPATEPPPTSKPRAARPTGGNGSGGTGAGAGAPVRSGTFCDPPATGISGSGTAMVCAPAADGRNRWKRA
jgi:hypothetical protein